MRFKRGQVTIFIIIAILLVVAVIVFFAFRGTVTTTGMPASIEPAYTSFLSCLEDDVSVGVGILESQAGYIYVPEFEPGSSYMPFSNQLDFLGNPVPYWYYVSSNNIQEEQVPSKKIMEEQLGKFIEERARDCGFETYYQQGFEIEQGEPNAKVSIGTDNVALELQMNFKATLNEENAIVNSHKINFKSKLGTLYDSAKKIYNKEQKELFLENYGIDTLYLYAPVEGVEVTCSPKTWSGDEIFNELQDAIEANTLALKTKNSDYTLRKKENEYFVIDAGVSENVRFINSKNWPYSFEVAPSEESVLIATPVGNQAGLGILGFCYVPYHFVYNINYPVLIQVQDGDEVFQFPVAVVIRGNKPREPLAGSASEIGVTELCKYKNTMIGVNTYDTKMNSVEADISYECFGEVCSIGKTSSGYLEKEFPQCVNGYVIAKADGFEETKQIYTTTQEGSVSVFLDKLYEKEVNLKLDNRDYNSEAIINFVSEDSSKSIVYPEQKSIALSPGQYEVQVYVYKNSTLELEATTKQQCVDIPAPGLSGLIGMKKEKCFDIQIPSQIVSNALAGGGKEDYYVSESELESSNVIEINANAFPAPRSLEQLQENYILFENNELEIVFK